MFFQTFNNTHFVASISEGKHFRVIVWSVFLLFCSQKVFAQLSDAILPHGNLTHATDVFNNANQTDTSCIAANFSCTANDFRITNINITNVDDACSNPDDYMQIDAEVTFNSATPTRYDIGVWFYRGDDETIAPTPDFNNQSAQGGDICTRDILAVGLDIFAQDGNPAGPIGQTALVDGNAGNPDSCPDSAQPEPGELVQALNNLRLPCRDVGVSDPSDPENLLSTTPDGVVDFSACTSWDNNANTQCDGPGFDGLNEPVPGTGSKCNCGEFNGNPNPVEIPNIVIDKTCADTFIAPGASTICTIVISNTGGGEMDGALTSIDEGFFFEDDFPEDPGSVSLIMGPDLDPTPNAQGLAEEGFTSNDNGTLTSNESLNIYPGLIPSGGSVTVSYTFTADGVDPIAVETVTNTVCTSYYDFGQGASVEVFDYMDICDSFEITTPVTLSSFSATQTAYSGSVDFHWTTATEVGNLGFNIYAILGKTLYKLNDQIIPSKVVNSMQSNSYSLSVLDTMGGSAKGLYIEDVAINGDTQRHGPFQENQAYGDPQVNNEASATDWSTINAGSQVRKKHRKTKFAKSQKRNNHKTARKTARIAEPRQVTGDAV